ncbi:MAG: DNA-directed RNA polymerase subunit beta' [Candidatus Pacebacteria bacterium]|nr:DNA-directed RNA polymerase subunit beta' [Candidatus Paceibacterota bacterium]
MNLKAIKITLASPEEILKWSHGEVIKPETINYRTQRPEKDGLFSERIFGPAKDWECYCGKYRRARYKGLVCDKCGVEVTRSIVRRERMGHIALAAPIAHIWYFKNVPSKIGTLLNIPPAKLEKVIYYAIYIVVSVNEEARKRVLGELEKEFKTRKKALDSDKEKESDLRSAMSKIKKTLESLKIGQTLTELEYFSLAKRFGEVFEASSGAEAVRNILAKTDLKKLITNVEEDIKDTQDPLKEAKLLKRLKIARSFYNNEIKPEWMIMTVLPVLPPDLRPMVALDGGRYATSDLNDLYRRVINRNNRLKKLIELKAPDVIVVNEKRMLQEAVDSLIDNSQKMGSQQMSTLRRPLRSLADMLKGKQGRFRQNLLGKRVDYSGRSVIVVGPNLRLGECGLPKKMALELFKPFVIQKIIERGLAHNIRNSNRLIEQATPEIWAILEEVIQDKKVLLNRAPTLHRLGVQAFKPILVEGLAIQIPPLVCTAFNADFDGDQMAVHVPLSSKAQKEARELMLSSLNLLKPATGESIATPTKDVVLGSYYLTKEKAGVMGEGKIFSSNKEAMLAYDAGFLDINAKIKIFADGEKLETTLGKLIFNSALPESFRYINYLVNKKELEKICSELVNNYESLVAAKHLDDIKDVGFKYATISGITWGMNELIVPKEKPEILKQAEKEAAVVRGYYLEGVLTNSERKERIIEIWKKATDSLKKLIPKSLDQNGSVFMIIDSGARGSWAQPSQMMGMKGLVANPKNETIELPIRSSYKEGFNVLEYFIATHGARKGLADTALKTAQAGYLTRRLVDVAQDMIVRDLDCGAKDGIEVVKSEGSKFGQSFVSRLVSRVALDDVKVGNKILVKAGEYITKAISEEIDASGLESTFIRSPLTCKTLYGVCQKCYGFDLGTNKIIKLGEAVGIVAAQSIGEPGTQLTMRTFHIGGVAGADITHGLPRVEEIFEARTPKGKGFIAEEDGTVIDIEERGSLKIIKIKTGDKNDEKVSEYPIPKISQTLFKVGEQVRKGDYISEGSLDLREIFKIKGVREAEKYIISEVQKIYMNEGAQISNKHLEVIARQMFSRVRISDPGDSGFVSGEMIEKPIFIENNRRLRRDNKIPAKAKQLLMGVTKVASSAQSFLSAASFQETVKALTGAALEGRHDTLRGLKENVIIGRLIPAGTGYRERDSDGLEALEFDEIVGQKESSIS